MSRKQIALFAAGLLATAGAIASQFPGAGPAVGIGLHAAGEGLKQVGTSLLDDCPGNICAGGAIHGDVGFTDGGQTCRCP